MKYTQALSIVMRVLPLILEVAEALKDKKVSHVEMVNLIDSAIKTALESLKDAK